MTKNRETQGRTVRGGRSEAGKKLICLWPFTACSLKSVIQLGKIEKDYKRLVIIKKKVSNDDKFSVFLYRSNKNNKKLAGIPSLNHLHSH